MQLIVEPARGLCGNHKPNRFLGIERKRINGALLMQGLIYYLSTLSFFEWGDNI